MKELSDSSSLDGVGRPRFRPRTQESLVKRTVGRENEILAGLGPVGAGTGLTASQSTLELLATTEHTRCLLCGPANALGPRLRFRVQTDGSVLARFLCREILQSYPEMLHGGVISALLDAAMTNALFSVGVVGVTAELTVRFLAPVALDRGAMVCAAIEKASPPLYLVRGELAQEGRFMARASGKFLVKGCMQGSAGEQAG
jgi:acyl-coenzyme A thioesterase PaaI-like protein